MSIPPSNKRYAVIRWNEAQRRLVTSAFEIRGLATLEMQPSQFKVVGVDLSFQDAVELRDRLEAEENEKKSKS
jgi:hypothetical protein